MNLVINGEDRTVDGGRSATVEGLLAILDIEARRGVAVAVNDEVVPRSRWKDTSLADGDRVEIIRATQGG